MCVNQVQIQNEPVCGFFFDTKAIRKGMNPFFLAVGEV